MKLWGKSPFEEQAEKEGPEKKMWKNNGQKGVRKPGAHGIVKAKEVENFKKENIISMKVQEGNSIF